MKIIYLFIFYSIYYFNKLNQKTHDKSINYLEKFFKLCYYFFSPIMVFHFIVYAYIHWSWQTGPDE